MEHNVLIPNLMVEDVSATVRFYQDVLGFELVVAVTRMADGMGENNMVTKLEVGQVLDWANMKANGAEFMFQSRASIGEELPVLKDAPIAASQTLYIRWQNIDEQFERLRDKVEVVQEPIDKFYGMREWYLRDCNGYILCFGEQTSQ